MDSSDSDEELLPSVNSFDALFARVHQEIRKEAASKLLPSSSKNVKNPSANKPTKRSAPEEKSSTKKKLKKAPPNRKDSESVHVSKETRNLIAEMDKLITGTTAGPSTSSPESSGSVEQPETVSRGRGRPKKKKALVLEDSEDDSIQLSDSDASSDDYEEKVVEPVIELYSLRIRWKSEVLRFKVSPDAKMSQVRMDLGQRISIRADDLVILDGQSNEEVPDNNLVTTIPVEKTLEAYQRERSLYYEPISANVGGIAVNTKNVDPNYVVIKLQGCGGYRERYTVVIKRTTHVKQLVDDYVEKFKRHGKKFKLQFDGDDIDLTETPESLDLEDGDMIDVREV